MKNILYKVKHLSQKGFTLIEMLVVIIVIAILAAIMVPQFSSSTEDANVSALKSNLAAMRHAVELYYHQHNSRYPGIYSETDGTTTGLSAAASATAFEEQLTQYTDRNGKVNGTKTAVYKYGPFIKTFELPSNPFIDGASASAILCDILVSDVTVAATATTAAGEGWKFYILTGRFVANDGLTLSDGATQTIDF